MCHDDCIGYSDVSGTAFERPVEDSISKINQELAVGEDLDFQRRWWRFERVVWYLFVALIFLDLAGVFGRGPLAKASVSSANHAIRASYERIERAGTPSMMTVTIDATTDEAVQLFVSDAAIDGLGLQRVIPAPESTTIGDGGLTYRFPRGSLPAIVRFEFQPVGAGIYHLTIGSSHLAPIPVTIVVVP
jgi:hypothetical protein